MRNEKVILRICEIGSRIGSCGWVISSGNERDYVRRFWNESAMVFCYENQTGSENERACGMENGTRRENESLSESLNGHEPLAWVQPSSWTPSFP